MYFVNDGDAQNRIFCTTKGWAVMWNGAIVEDGLTRDAAVTKLRQLQTQGKK